MVFDQLTFLICEGDHDVEDNVKGEDGHHHPLHLLERRRLGHVIAKEVG